MDAVQLVSCQKPGRDARSSQTWLMRIGHRPELEQNGHSFQVERSRALAPSRSFTIGDNHVTQTTGSQLVTSICQFVEEQNRQQDTPRSLEHPIYSSLSSGGNPIEDNRHRNSCDHILSRQWHDAAKRIYSYTERHMQILGSGATLHLPLRPTTRLT